MSSKEDVPFGPASKYYNYRCSHCKEECEFNEVIIDAAIAWAEFNGEYCEGVMPNLECPCCNQKIMEYVKD